MLVFIKHTETHKSTRNMFKLILSFFFIGTSPYVARSQNCIGIGQPCGQTCDCCDYDTDPGIRCEERNKGMGMYCFTGKFCGDPCTNNSDCYSQNCGYPSTYVRRLEAGPGQKICMCNAKGVQACSCPITMASAALDDDPPYESKMGADPMHAIDGNVNTYLFHDWDKKCAVILTPKDPTEYTHVCGIKVTKYDDKEPAKIYLQGWCSSKGTWVDIPLKGNDLNLFENMKSVINPRSNGPYASFRALFWGTGDGDGVGTITVSKIELLYRCDG